MSYVLPTMPIKETTQDAFLSIASKRFLKQKHVNKSQRSTASLHTLEGSDAPQASQ